MSCDTTNALCEKERGHYPTILTEYGQRDLFLAGLAQGVPCGARVANQKTTFVLSCSLEI